MTGIKLPSCVQQRVPSQQRVNQRHQRVRSRLHRRPKNSLPGRFLPFRREQPGVDCHQRGKHHRHFLRQQRARQQRERRQPPGCILLSLRIAPVEKRRKGRCGKHRYHGVRSCGNPCDRFNVNGMQRKNQRSERRRPVFQSQPSRQPKHSQHRAHVQQNRSQVPSPGPQSEQRVIQHRPRHEQRPVVHLVSRHVVPQVTPERARQIAPCPDDRTVHNLRPVIPYKIERQRAAVNHKSDQPQQWEQDARLSQILGQQLRCAGLRMPLCLVHVLRVQSRSLRSRSAHSNRPSRSVHVTQVT